MVEKTFPVFKNFSVSLKIHSRRVLILPNSKDYQDGEGGGLVGKLCGMDAARVAHMDVLVAIPNEPPSFSVRSI